MQPGTTVRQILEYRLANGFYKTEDFVDTLVNRLGAVAGGYPSGLADGRIIHVTYRQHGQRRALSSRTRT